LFVDATDSEASIIGLGGGNFTHTYREANKCANAIANEGCTLDYEVTT
jgi:hypothetical protein